MSEHQSGQDRGTACGPLAGIRVLDLTRVMSGPFATMVLGDLGADVIKLEEPSHGDETRQWGPPFHAGESAYFLSINRNKRSLAVDLKNPERVASVKTLARTCDVIVENFRPGVAARLGLGYEDLSVDNPGLIYASISGYGQSGPEARKAGYDPIMQARSGLMSITGDSDGGPARVGVALADISAAMWTVIGVLAALHHRDSTGVGQTIDIALFDAQISLLTNVAGSWFTNGDVPRRHGTGHPSLVPSEAYGTRDGLLMVAIGNDKMFSRFIRALDAEAELGATRFATNPGRVQHRDELRKIIERRLIAEPRDVWVRRFDEADVPAAPVNNIAEALQDEQLRVRGMVVELAHSAVGTVQSLGSPLKMSATPPTMRQPPPVLGEHNDQIFGALEPPGSGSSTGTEDQHSAGWLTDDAGDK